MKEEPSTSSGIKRSIPQELQDKIDEIVSKRSRTTAKLADLDENQKRWLVVGICLHSVISPALRNYVVPILTKLCYTLSVHHRLETQTFPTRLPKHPPTNKTFLNYEGVNNNKVKHGYYKQRYDYKIKSVVDLSKLFLQTHMAYYTGFDDTCDSSALLGLIINIDQFDPIVKSVALNVRRYIRNDWAHCAEWDAVKFSNSFQLMKKLVKELKLSLNEETQIIGEIEKWEMNGPRFLSGTTYGLELVNEFRQQTRALAEYSQLVATETDSYFIRKENELKKNEILLLHKVDQLKKDIDKRLFEIDEVLVDQDKTLKNHDTQLG
ncbi:uncharacterized protein LOC134692212 [Mytilus trossulus]|uniref:uncharacterized protein LOC134692212 n=1 Tax=Mytilus trossulus TaxID=6551 RepID=UPI003004A178